MTPARARRILDRNGKPLAIDGAIGQIGIVPGELGRRAGNEAASQSRR